MGRMIPYSIRNVPKHQPVYHLYSGHIPHINDSSSKMHPPRHPEFHERAAKVPHGVANVTLKPWVVARLGMCAALARLTLRQLERSWQLSVA
jgi:hypothetical protein